MRSGKAKPQTSFSISQHLESTKQSVQPQPHLKKILIDVLISVKTAAYSEAAQGYEALEYFY